MMDVETASRDRLERRSGMIQKEREYPYSIKQLTALKRRLPQNHLKYDTISEQLAKKMAGYKGEQSIDYYLSYLNENEYDILHDIRLFSEKHYFQIDTLIITKSFIVIIEVKNLRGTLHLDGQFNQLIRTLENKKEAFPDPILQVERQKVQLERWLKREGFQKLPIEGLVVISSPKTILEASPQDKTIHKKVIHSAKIPLHINLLNKRFTNNVLTEKQLLFLIKTLSKQHAPLKTNYLSQYNISKESILTGVICTNCSMPPMEWRKGKWFCQLCSYQSKEAHYSALEDYSLLINETITNKEFREFLHIPSTSIANKLIASLQLTSSGKNKGKVYFLTEGDST